MEQLVSDVDHALVVRVLQTVLEKEALPEDSEIDIERMVEMMVNSLKICENTNLRMELSKCFSMLSLHSKYNIDLIEIVRQFTDENKYIRPLEMQLNRFRNERK